MADLLDVAVRLVAVVAAFLVLPLIVGQMEHKAMAHMQSRLGPMYAGGFHEWAQLIADGVKFAQKEDVVPAAADRRVFAVAPAVALVPYLVMLIVIPVGPGLAGVDLDAGLFFVLAVMGVGVLGSIMAGWASANKYSLLGGIRAAAGIRFALFMLAEYAGIVVLSVLTTVPRRLAGAPASRSGLDAHQGVRPGVRGDLGPVSYLRLREDQLQKLAWIGLVPLALLQLVLTGIVKVLVA